MLPRETPGENPDNTDNANFPETHENPATKDAGLTDEIPSKKDDEPWWLKNVEGGQIDPVDTRNHTTNNLKSTDECTEAPMSLRQIRFLTATT